MALVSMTGYGRGRASGRGIAAEVEIFAVNGRQLDIRVQAPKDMLGLEAAVSGLVAKKVAKGRVSCHVRVERAPAAAARTPLVDTARAAALLREIRSTARRLGLRDDISASTLLAVAGFVLKDRQITARAAWPAVRKAVTVALSRLSRARESEGLRLENDIRLSLSSMNGILARLERQARGASARYRARLAALVRQAAAAAAGKGGTGDALGAVSKGSLYAEIAQTAARSDINEEIVRLRSHLARAFELIGKPGLCGRELDFLCQEMQREIGTIGAKAADAAVSRSVVAFKVRLDRVREQAQNVQ